MIFTKYCLGDQIKKNKIGVACSTYGEEERCIQGWWGNLRERDHLDYPGIDGRIILRWIFKKWDEAGLELYGSGQGQVAGTCKCGNESSVSIKCGEFLDWLSTG